MAAVLPWLIVSIVAGIVIPQWLRSSESIWNRIGFARKAVVPDFAAGVGIGALAMAGVFVVHLVLAQIVFTDGAPEIGDVLIAIPLLLALALMEEVVFRGLLLNGLIYLLKRQWLAVLICGVLFGIAHSSNPGATPLSVVSNGLGGVMYSLAFLGTRRVWLPLGVHFAWNYFQGPVFGFLVSGFDFGTLISQTSIGDPLLTGGAYGPEGGLIGIGFRFVVMVLVVLWCRRTNAKTIAP